MGKVDYRFMVSEETWFMVESMSNACGMYVSKWWAAISQLAKKYILTLTDTVYEHYKLPGLMNLSPEEVLRRTKGEVAMERIMIKEIEYNYAEGSELPCGGEETVVSIQYAKGNKTEWLTVLYMRESDFGDEGEMHVFDTKEYVFRNVVNHIYCTDCLDPMLGEWWDNLEYIELRRRWIQEKSVAEYFLENSQDTNNCLLYIACALAKMNYLDRGEYVELAEGKYVDELCEAFRANEVLEYFLEYGEELEDWLGNTEEED